MGLQETNLKYTGTHLQAFFSWGAFSSRMTLKQKKNMLRLIFYYCCKYMIIVSLIDGKFWKKPTKEKDKMSEGRGANTINP